MARWLSTDRRVHCGLRKKPCRRLGLRHRCQLPLVSTPLARTYGGEGAVRVSVRDQAEQRLSVEGLVTA